jgi:PadR family transcriptional regulator PadR
MATDSTRRSQLLRGALDLCLLAVIHEEPAYGYEMTKRLSARGLSIVGEGSIYPLLGRLERDGLVETYRAVSDGGPPRKYYRTSHKGQRTLEDGVAEWHSARDAVDGVLGLIEAEVKP